VFQGEIAFSLHTLTFQSGEITWEIPLQHLEAEVRVGDEDRITFTDPSQPGMEFFADDFSILDCLTIPALVQARNEYHARLQKGEIRRRLKILAYCLGAVVLLTWLGSASMGLMVRVIANRVSPETDAKFGARVLKEVREEYTFLEDTNAVARLTALAQPLLRSLPPTPNGYTFYIVDDDDPNAFALPGGHIVVHTGLIKMVDRPEQLLAVIAHEVAHVTERHLYREQISVAGPIMVMQLFLGGRSGAVQLIGGISALVVGAGFSQEYETEADDVGWKYLVAANIDPSGVPEVLGKLKMIEDKEGEDLMPQSLSTHPATAKRIKRMDSKWKKLRKRAGFVVLDSEPILSR